MKIEKIKKYDIIPLSIFSILYKYYRDDSKSNSAFAMFIP